MIRLASRPTSEYDISRAETPRSIDFAFSSRLDQTDVPKKANTANQHASVRRDHSTEMAEDYVEAIAQLIEEDGECRLTEIARHFAVSHVTANRTVGRLKRVGLVQSEPYGPILLTPAGRRLAERCKRRHLIVYSFLLALGVPPEDAAVDAEGIEHHVGQSTLQAMERFAATKKKVVQR
jgi:DtxR family manganese transport transcriptional regulator